MQNRRSREDDWNDLDDWVTDDDIPEEQTQENPDAPKKKLSSDWAEETEEEKASKRKKAREEKRSRREGRQSGKKKSLAVVAAVAVLVAVAVTMALGPDRDPQDQAMVPTAPQVTIAPQIPDVTIPQETVPQVSPVETEPPAEATEPAVDIPEVTEPYAQPKEYRFYARGLTDQEKRAYDILAEAFFAQKETVEGICLPSEDSLFRVTAAVMDDYAELYWYSGMYNYLFFEREGYLEFNLTPDYGCTPAERAQKQALVDSKTQALLAELDGKSEYEKVKGVYEFLIDYTAYDWDYLGMTLYELFDDGRAVCAAYARATQYLLTKLDVEAIYLAGMAGDPGDAESHAWNIVKIDGDYYQLDTTWGDPYYEDGTQTKNFNYFCLTDEEMGRDHWADKEGYPACTATACNYFRQEGRFLESYDRELLKQWMREAEARGESLCFKVANAQLYQQVMTELLTNEDMFALLEEVLGEAVGYSYSCDDKFYIFTFTW